MKTVLRITLFLLFILFSIACEVPTKLTFKGGNPPQFKMTGSGSLALFRIEGSKKQRDVPDAGARYLYWEILPKSEYEYGRAINDVGTITYGEVPEGYIQKYPEQGEPPALIEGERYTV